MSARPVLRGASIGVRFTHFYHVFLGMPVVNVLHVTMIEIINVILTKDKGQHRDQISGERAMSEKLMFIALGYVLHLRDRRYPISSASIHRTSRNASVGSEFSTFMQGHVRPSGYEGDFERA
jgi:hypothetical protein